MRWVGSLLITAQLSVFLNLGFLRANQMCTGDDFDDGVYNGSRWAEVITDATWPSSWTEANGRAGFTGESFAVALWKCSYGSCLVDWEVVVDVHLGDVLLSENESHVEVSLAAFNMQDSNLQFGVPGDHLSIALDVYRDSGGSVERTFASYLQTNWVDVPFEGDVRTSSQEAGFRLSFHAPTRTLTAWYDPDGNVNGYEWTALRSAQVDHPESDWELTDDALIQVGLIASTDGFTVDSGHEVWVDDFAVIGAFVPIEPSTPVLAITKAEGRPVLELSGDVGRSYRIDHLPEIGAGANWQSLATILLTNGVQTYPDLGFDNRETRFYRAAVGP
jgi:hypothetical protein